MFTKEFTTNHTNKHELVVRENHFNLQIPYNKKECEGLRQIIGVRVREVRG